MVTKLKSGKQRQLFELLMQSGPLAVSAMMDGVRVRLQGHCQLVASAQGDRLLVGDSGSQLDIDWRQVNRLEVAADRADTLSFYNGQKLLFALQHPTAAFSPAILDMEGNLL